jgi:hypothetical protein
MVMATFDQHAQQVVAQYNAERMTFYSQATPHPVDPDTLAAAEQQFAALPLETLPDLAPLPNGSRMPFSHNRLFVGREADLIQLARALKGSGTAAIVPIAAAVGLGGIGKTQLAVEFVHHYGQYFVGGVFWLNFANPDAIPHEIAACGGAGGMRLSPDFNALSLNEQVHLVRNSWQSRLPRLLVFDNCEDEILVENWRPVSGGCRVLITSRRTTWDITLGVTARTLDVLPRDESITLLHTFRRDLAPDDPKLDDIAAELGDLPLALHLAGSYLAQHELTPGAYLDELRSSPGLLQHPSLREQDTAVRPTGHELNVKRTFELSYKQLLPENSVNILARVALANAAYLAPGEPIPQKLLIQTLSHDLYGWTDDTSVQIKDAQPALIRLCDIGMLDSKTQTDFAGTACIDYWPHSCSSRQSRRNLAHHL